MKILKYIAQWILFLLSIPASAIGMIASLYKSDKRRLIWTDNLGLDTEYMNTPDIGCWPRWRRWSVLKRPLHNLKAITAAWCDQDPAQRPAKAFSLIITVQALLIAWLLYTAH